MKMFKRNGKVGVLVSPGFGAGFSTWNSPEMAVAFDLVEAFAKLDTGFVQEHWDRFMYILNEKYPDAYDGGVRDLELEQVPEGSLFRVEEYDGNESIVILNETNTFMAQ